MVLKTMPVVLLVSLCGLAHAGGVHQAQGQDQSQSQNQVQDQSQSQDQSLTASQLADASSGDTTVRSENNSQFFAFGTTFPNSQGCFAGAQGGGSGNGGAGFLGFHYLDHNCWTSQLASQTRNVEVKARLNCSGGKFRNAIAYDQPRGQATRQKYCVDYMVSTYNAEIAEMKKYVDDAVAEGLLTVRGECDERVERCQAAVLK